MGEQKPAYAVCTFLKVIADPNGCSTHALLMLCYAEARGRRAVEQRVREEEAVVPAI